MTRSSWASVLVFLLLGGAGLVGWVWLATWSGEDGEQATLSFSREESVAEKPCGDRDAVAREEMVAVRTPALPTESQPMEKLPMETLRVTLDAGVMGRVRWLHGADPRRLHRPLHGVPDEDLPAWRTLPEALVLRVPKHDWLWICAELHDGSRRWTRYVRLPPARGPRALDLRGSAGPTIHGLVYADGLDSPAKGARLVAGRGNEEPRSVTCDEEGFFSLAGLPAAPVELKVQGEAIGAAPRNAMRVICGPAPPFDAHVITLVAPPHTTSIELDIAADAEQGQLDAARLALRRIDCDGTLVPLLSRIPRGSCRATLRVPAGDWVFDVVPRGVLDIVTPRESCASRTSRSLAPSGSAAIRAGRRSNSAGFGVRIFPSASSPAIRRSWRVSTASSSSSAHTIGRDRSSRSPRRRPPATYWSMAVARNG